MATALAASKACLPVGTVFPSVLYSPTIGGYSNSAGAAAWALIGATAVSDTIPAPALGSLRTKQLPSGGWEWSPGFGADTNTTALAVQALIAAGDGVTSTVIVKALEYLADTQKSDGGFPYATGATTESDVNSTAYVLQALWAVGEDPAAAPWVKPGGDPLTYLEGMQLSDGSFEWVPGSGPNQLATQQAIPGLLGWANPIARAADLAPCFGAHLSWVSKPE